MASLVHVPILTIALFFSTTSLPITPHYSDLARINPCDDFYGFSCNSWLTKAKKPPYEPIWNPWIFVGHEINRRLSKILTRPEPILLTPQTFYESCAKSADHQNDLISLVDDLGGWPLTMEKWDEADYDWLNQVARITRILGIHPIVKMHVDLDYKDPTRYILYLEPGNLVFPHYILVNPHYNAELEAYEKWIIETVRHLYGNKTSHVMEESVKEIIKFERLLAKIRENQSMNERTYVWKLSKKLPLDWLRAFHTVFGGFTELNDNTILVVKDGSYFKKLFLLTDKTPPEVVANYLIWTVIKDLSRDTTSQLRHLNFLIDRAILGVQNDLSRVHECVAKTIQYFSLALVPQYVNLYVKHQSFSMVNSMITAIKTEFINTLTSNAWLSEEAKLRSVEKIKNIRAHLGFPSWILNGNTLQQYYQNLRMTEDHFLNVLKLRNFTNAEHLARLGKRETMARWPSTPFDVNAYYSILQNSIFIPLGLLEPPFFHPEGPRTVNYGALGSLIGHELSHALDPAGISADKNGKIGEWWPCGDLTVYKKRMQCFNKDSLGEDIADSNGLKISLGALKKIDTTPRLGLFFISFAQMWCEMSEETDIFGQDEHAPVSERVNRSMDNDRDFRETFKCGSRNSCELW